MEPSVVDIYGMAYAHTQDECNTLLTEFCANMSHSVMQHVDAIWQACKAEWVLA